MTWPPKDPAEFVEELSKAGYAPEQILAGWHKLLKDAPDIISWKITQFHDENTKPDPATLKRWFGTMREAHNACPDEFIRREIRLKLQKFFGLDERTCSEMLADNRARPVAQQKSEEPALPQGTAIEIELLRRLYDSQAERDWWWGKARLLASWENDGLALLAYLFIQCDTEREIPLVVSQAMTEEEAQAIMIPLAFFPPMQESTEFLIAKHYNLRLPAQRTELAQLYAKSKNPAVLDMLKEMTALNLKDFPA